MCVCLFVCLCGSKTFTSGRVLKNLVKGRIANFCLYQLFFSFSFLQIEPNQNHLLTHLEGTLFAWLFVRLSRWRHGGVTVGTTIVVIWDFSFFLLPSKKEWALVYCPEALCLHSAASYTDCTNELDLYTWEIPYALGLLNMSHVTYGGR